MLTFTQQDILNLDRGFYSALWRGDLERVQGILEQLLVENVPADLEIPELPERNADLYGVVRAVSGLLETMAANRVVAFHDVAPDRLLGAEVALDPESAVGRVHKYLSQLVILLQKAAESQAMIGQASRQAYERYERAKEGIGQAEEEIRELKRRIEQKKRVKRKRHGGGLEEELQAAQARAEGFRRALSDADAERQRRAREGAELQRQRQQAQAYFLDRLVDVASKEGWHDLANECARVRGDAPGVLEEELRTRLEREATEQGTVSVSYLFEGRQPIRWKRVVVPVAAVAAALVTAWAVYPREDRIERMKAGAPTPAKKRSPEPMVTVPTPVPNRWNPANPKQHGLLLGGLTDSAQALRSYRLPPGTEFDVVVGKRSYHMEAEQSETTLTVEWQRASDESPTMLRLLCDPETGEIRPLFPRDMLPGRYYLTLKLRNPTSGKKEFVDTFDVGS